jgi:hypothetical protein
VDERSRLQIAPVDITTDSVTSAPEIEECTCPLQEIRTNDGPGNVTRGRRDNRDAHVLDETIRTRDMQVNAPVADAMPLPTDVKGALGRALEADKLGIRVR